MFFPNYKELDFKVKIVKRGMGEDERFVPDLPDIPYGLVLVFCNGFNHYAYPLPPETEGQEAICHVVYHTEDSEAMDNFAGKLGLGNEVTKTDEYKSVVKQTVGEKYIADEQARLIREVEAKGEVVKQEDLDVVKYEGVDKDDGYPVFVFLQKGYVDK